jgi:serine/threonine-protein kinase/endoribonuclease IRE1
MPRGRPKQRDVPAANNLFRVFLVACLCVVPYVAAESKQHQRAVIQRESPAEHDRIIGTPLTTERRKKTDTSSIQNHNTISKNDVSAIAALAPADSAVAAPPSRRYVNEWATLFPDPNVSGIVRHSDFQAQPLLTLNSSRSSNSNAGLASLHNARSLEDWEVEDFVLLATVDGKLHGRDRKTGRQLWPPIQSERPMVETTHYRRNRSAVEDGYEAAIMDQYVWAIEPSRDGGLYVLRNGQGIIDTGLTMKKLVEDSPYLDNEMAVMYTGKKETTMYEIDAGNGQVRKFTGFEDSINTAICSNRNGFMGNEEEECKPNATFSLGRTEYTVGISGGKDRHQIAQLKFAEWVINNRDLDLQRQYHKTFDNNYIRTSHNGGVVGVGPDPTEKPSFKQSLGSSPVARVFDVIRPWATEDDEEQLIALSQPIPTQWENDILADSRANDIFLSHTEVPDSPEDSWYVLSSKYYPGAVEGTRRATIYDGEYENDLDLENFIGLHSIDNQHKRDNTMSISGPDDLPIENSLAVDSPTFWQLFIRQITFEFQTRDFIMALVVLYLGWLAAGDKIKQKILKKFPGITFLIGPNQTPQDDAIRTHDVRETRDIPHVPVDDTIERQLIKTDETQDNEPVTPKPDVMDDQQSNNADKTPSTDVTDTSQIPTEANQPSVPATAEGEEPKLLRKRGKRGGKRHKKHNGSAKSWSASQDGDSIDPKPPATVDDAVKMAQKLGGHFKLEPDTTSGPSSSPADISGPIIKVGSITVNMEKSIGTGSNGTVVYEGNHGGRRVAVKRMLMQFYEIASREIELLIESDHKNVVRYYNAEQRGEFLYIALDLCPASLADIVDKPDQHKELAHSGQKDLPSVLYQITSGLNYLHGLRIVHRDLKPQNILVKMVDGQPQLMVSDFGLCKKLEGEQSFFGATTAHAAGTSGWRAPELLLDDDAGQGQTMIDASTNGDSEPLINSDLLPNRRATRAIDIFSLGLVFYYVLTQGSHPFDCGDRYMREVNIRKGNFNLEHVNLNYEARDLIEKMLDANPKKRPTASEVLAHPFFWSSKKRLAFLCDVSDQFEAEPREPPSAALQLLEDQARGVIYKDFTQVLGDMWIEELRKQRKYVGTSLLHLLRAIRNKKNHYQDLSDKLQKHVGSLPEGYLHYWTSKFPNLLITCWNVIYEGNWDEEDRFKEYYEANHMHP